MTKFIAVGPHAGKTITLGRFEFVDGVYEYEGPTDEEHLVAKTLEDQFSAVREDRAEEAQATYEDLVAKTALEEPKQTPSAVEEGVKDRLVARRFIVERLSPEAVYGKGEAADRVMAMMQKLIEEDALASGMELGDYFKQEFGDGRQPEQKQPESQGDGGGLKQPEPQGDGGQQPAKPETVADALKLLDASNDEHWTSRGIPSVDAVSASLGRAVTRAEIEEAIPDFNRTAAKAAASN